MSDEEGQGALPLTPRLPLPQGAEGEKAKGKGVTTGGSSEPKATAGKLATESTQR